MKRLFYLLVLMLIFTGCNELTDKKIKIGNPKKVTEPVNKGYVILYPGWNGKLTIDDYVMRTDSALAYMQYRIDSLIYELNK